MSLMTLIGLLFTVVLAVAGLIVKNSNRLFNIQCIWFWILYGLNMGGIDYENNKAIYIYTFRLRHFSLVNGLQNITGYVGNHFGLDYLVYNAIMGAFCVIIIHFVIKNSSQTPSFVMSLFYIYPMYDCVIQKRFFIGMCFALLAFYFWIHKDYKKYVLFCVIAVGFHVSMILYLIFPLVMLISRKSKLIVAIFMFIEVLGHKVLDRLILSTPFAGKYIEYTKSQQYSSIVVGLLFVMLQLVFILLILRMWIFWEQTASNEMKEIYLINIASILLLPLLLFGATWLRYFRIFQIYNYGYLGNRSLESRDPHKESYWWIKGYVMLLFLSELVITAVGDSGISGILETVFENNWLLMHVGI